LGEVYMRSAVHVFARTLLSLAFIVLGWDAAREPGGRVKVVAALGIPRPDLAVRANGSLMVASGAMLLLGIRPRAAALTLVALMVPTTLAGHPFWQVNDPQQRKGQRIHFLKNLSMIGGLLFVALSGDRHDTACSSSRRR